MVSRDSRWLAFAQFWSVTFALFLAADAFAQCGVTVTDITEWNPVPQIRSIKYLVEVSGGYDVGAHLHEAGAPSWHNAAFFEHLTIGSGNLVATCLAPGAYEVEVFAMCGADGRFIHETVPVMMPDHPVTIEITAVTRVSAGKYRVEAASKVPAGLLASGYWAAYKRLPDGTFAEPVQYQSNIVDATYGDKVSVTVGGCFIENNSYKTATAFAVVPPPPEITVAVVSGDGQRAVPGEVAEKSLKVKLTASDPTIALAGLPALFEIISVPTDASGQGVGATDVALGSPYSATVGTDGTASARIVVGDKPGAYVVRVKSPLTTTGSQALFTTTAVIPASVGIVKDSTEVADLASAYAVSATDPTIFHAIGLDGAGQKIGPMRCAWSTSAKGNPSTRGEGTLAPTLSARTTTFQPAKPGKLSLNAKSAVKGVGGGAADLFVTRLYVSVQNTFNPNAPIDDTPKFVPGMYLDGTSVALDVMKTTGQFISLHLITGGAKGKATFSVDSTNHPGIAMNYPLAGDASKDMQFTNGQQSITVDFNSATGDTWTTLLVRDFAAAGTVRVSIQSGKSSYVLKGLKLPVDANENSLPDAGWRVGPSLVPINANVLTPDEDFDTDPFGSGAPFEGTVGDGLTAVEEYRGFVVAGSHQRLDPARKDLFLVADPEMLTLPVNALAILTSLPHSLHYLEEHEAVLTESADPAEAKVRPVINPNRAGITGSYEQRAIRLRLRMDAPVFHEDSTGQDYPGHFVALGYTWRDGEDLSTIHELSSVGVSTPNGTLAVELYPLGFRNFAIHFGPDNVTNSTVDPYGNPVVPCTNEFSDAHCVVVDTARRVLRKPVQEPQLYAVAGGDDYYTKFAWGDCPLFMPGAAIVMSPSQFQQAHTTVAGHEVGHALRLTHQNSVCSNIMFTLALPTAQGPVRHPISDVLPLPTSYDTSAVQGMRLHENQ